MKNPFGQIVSFEDYVDIIGIPKEQLNSEEVKNRINKWLVQATEQFDSMISGNGQLGRLYRWFEKLEDNEEDNYKKYKLIKAICSWVETFVIKGKFWVDGLPVINSNVDIQINSSSNDSNVEAKRKDIIQDLVSVGLYQTTNFGDNGTFQDNQQNAEQLIEDLIVLSTSELQQNYLRLNPQKSLEGNLDFANNDLVNGGNIIGSTQQARNNIQYYNIIDSTIDLNKNTIIGTLGQDPTTAADIAQINQNIANINQEQITQNTNISNNENEINAIKAKDIEQNNRLTQLEQETEDNFNEIANIKTKDQQQDTTIQSNTTNINANTNSISTLNQQVANNKNLLDQTIDGLRTLKPFQYVGEYQNGTSYKINQLVSYNNNLYLSKEDNNTTTPPSDKWLLVNKETINVDLSDYYNKLEVEAIKNNLQQSITSNTTNITDLTNRTNTIEQNYVSKTTTTAQTIASQITFTQTDMVLKFNSGTNNSAYLAGFKSGNQRVWYFGKGSSTSDNFIIGADRGVIKLEPSTHVDVSNKRIINVADPTAIKDGVNKQYVDNLNNQNVKLTGDQRIEGNKIIEHATIVYGEVSQLSTVNQELSLVNKKYVDDAINTAIGNNSGVADLANQLTTINQTLEEHELEINSYGSLIQSNIDGITQNRVNIAANGRNIQSNTSNIQSNTNQITYLKSHTVTNDTDQTINGTKTFAMKILANGGITNLVDPTNDNDVVNKKYVDNIKNTLTTKVSSLENAIGDYKTNNTLYTIYSNTTIYNNLNKINTNIFNNSNVDYNKPLTVSFTRTNNSGTDYGSYTFQIQYGIGENNFIVGSNLYYDRSKTYGQLGDWVALTITPSYIQVQCWNGGDRIKNIKVQGWKKVI